MEGNWSPPPATKLVGPTPTPADGTVIHHSFDGSTVGGVTAITFFVDSDCQLDQANGVKNTERAWAAITVHREVAAAQRLRLSRHSLDLIFGPAPCYKQEREGRLPALGAQGAFR
jgi:hypothetical protein